MPAKDRKQPARTPVRDADEKPSRAPERRKPRQPNRVPVRRPERTKSAGHEPVAPGPLASGELSKARRLGGQKPALDGPVGAGGTVTQILLATLDETGNVPAEQLGNAPGGGASIPTSAKGAANGVATLDSSSKLTAAQLPTVVTATQQAGDYTFALTDAGTVVEGTKATAQAFTIPPHTAVAFPVGTVLEVFQDGVGAITLTAGAGVTLRSDGSKVATAAQYATVGLRQRAQDEWVLSGDLA